MVAIIPLQYEHRPSNSFLSLSFHGLHLMMWLNAQNKLHSDPDNIMPQVINK